MRVTEQENIVRELELALQHLMLQCDRRLTLQQKDHEQKMQLILLHCKGTWGLLVVTLNVFADIMHNSKPLNCIWTLRAPWPTLSLILVCFVLTVGFTFASNDWLPNLSKHGQLWKNGNNQFSMRANQECYPHFWHPGQSAAIQDNHGRKPEWEEMEKRKR